VTRLFVRSKIFEEFEERMKGRDIEKDREREREEAYQGEHHNKHASLLTKCIVCGTAQIL